MFAYKYEIVMNILNKQDGITQNDLDNIRDASDDELVEINKTIGIRIRSLYSLWNVKNLNCFEFKTERMLIHPNDFSLEVFKEVREKLNEEFY
jgi:hypothetical protein